MSDYSPKRRQRRVAVPVIVAGGLSSLLLAFSFTPTFSALTAAITNSGNTAGTGTLVMEETGPNSTGVNVTCTTGADGTATCATINKFGGANPSSSGYLAMKAGDSQTTSIKIKNTGSIGATNLTVKGGACTDAVQSGATVSGTATTLCDLYTIAVYKSATATGTPAWTGTASGFASATAYDLGAVAAGATTDVTIKVTLGSATAANQGRSITQPIVWSFQA